MADKRVKGSDHESRPKIGHNRKPEEPVVWERWTRKRTFVRALEGTYGELGEELFDRLQVVARPYLQSGAAGDRLGGFPASPETEAMHRYMDGLFADLLKACIDDGEQIPPSARLDTMAA